MIVEKEHEGNNLSYSGSDAEPSDRFPVGMRVLAVDDNRACLKVLEKLLLRCQYHVTTTTRAETALKLLRENKDEFDIVISDVHMPDMDGFKLLELVGLEMDLPVIMLSSNDDTKSVMRGITHGACDYLVKPVRIKELRNIWQHVVRRRNSCNKARVKPAQPSNEAGEEVRDGGGIPRDRSAGLGDRKRKDQNGEDEYDSEENRDAATTQKKQRVIWAGDLQRKFVEAVNYLGVNNAVPKKILELMGGENLTRENVASHLQKYRQLLKKISNATSQQANNVMVALEGCRQLPTLSSLQQRARFGSVDGPTAYAFPNPHKNPPSLPTKGFATLPCVNASGIKRASCFNQGMMAPSSTCRQPMLQSDTTFAASLPDVKPDLGGSPGYSFFGATNNFFQSSQQQPKECSGIGINSADRVTPLFSDSLRTNAGASSQLSDPGEYHTGTWARFDCMLNRFHYHGNQPPSSDIWCNLTSSNRKLVSQPLSDPTTAGDLLQTQANPFSGRALNPPTGTHEGQLADFRSTSNSDQGRDQTPHKPISSFNPFSNNMFSDNGCRGDAPNRETDNSSIVDQLNFSSTFLKQDNNDVERSATYNQINFIGDHPMEPTDLSGYDSNAHDSFENLFNSLVKQEQQSVPLDGGGDIWGNSLFN